MKNLICLTIIIIFSFSLETNAEIYWDKTFGGINGDYGCSLAICSDGGYIITGYTYSYGTGSADVLLIKTDAEGNKQWDKTFGVKDFERGNSVAVCDDNGYIITGLKEYYNSLSEDVWLIKTDAEGNKQWDKTFGEGSSNYGESVAVCNDGGYIITGTNGGSDIWLIKTDAEGNKQWDKTFSDNIDHGYSVATCNDGGYIILGGTEYYYNGSVWLIKVDTHGNEQWDNYFCFGHTYDIPKSVAVCNDGYIITGYGYSSGTVSIDVWLIKTDAFGNMQWEKSFGGNKYDYAYSVAVCGDGGYIITGKSGGSFNDDDYDVWLIKTDNFGNIQWDKTFGEANKEDGGYSVQQTGDNGYIIAGSTESYGAGYFDVWLIYYNPEGGDTIPPSAVTNLTASTGSANYEIDLTWTAPGDDGESGTATEYDIRYYDSEITDENWDNSIPLEGEPIPHSSGTSESWSVNMPEPSTMYFFAIKSIDDGGNISEISNCACAYSLPVILSSFEASYIEGNVLLTWVTESEKNNLGWNIYRSDNPRIGFTKINQELIPGAGNSSTPQYYNYLDDTIETNKTYQYYLENIDLNGNTYNSWVVKVSTMSPRIY